MDATTSLPERVLETVVVGAGQAGLSASHHLARLGIDHVVLDAGATPGGAWQHRPRSMRVADVHGVAQLPDRPLPHLDPTAPARSVLPAYFADYERTFDLPVLRPVRVRSVANDRDAPDLLAVGTDAGPVRARTVVNATGTWGRPFIPTYPGADAFGGAQRHSSEYDGPAAYAGRRVLVVGAGTSAVQLLGEVAPVAATTRWVTRRPPVWRTGPFDREAGRAAVALVEDRVRRGLPPGSVASATGLALREQEQQAAALGAFDRRPLFARLDATGAVWPDGRHEPFDAVLWATGFRPDVGHLAPLGLRGPGGGIALDGTTVVVDPRVQLVGYGPSASTIGANRAGRAAAAAVRDRVRTPEAAA